MMPTVLSHRGKHPRNSLLVSEPSPGSAPARTPSIGPGVAGYRGVRRRYPHLSGLAAHGMQPPMWSPIPVGQLRTPVAGTSYPTSNPAACLPKPVTYRSEWSSP